MPMGLIFWVLMLIWLVFGAYNWNWPSPYGPVGHSLLIFILFLLLGWQVFGAPVR